MSEVQAQIVMTAEANAFSVAAYVSSSVARPLNWTLTVDAKGRAGSTVTVQRGRTDGRSHAPVSVSRVNAPGYAVLEVSDRGETVARADKTFGERDG